MSELQDLLLQQMMAGQQPNNGDMARMFAEHDDPRVRLISQYMSRETSPVDPVPVTDADVIVEDVIEQDAVDVMPEDPPRDPRRLRRKLRLLAGELRTAQTIGDTLAAALGACYLCWGEDHECEHCDGAGVPGWSMPDPELFATYIAPAMERLSQRIDPAGPITEPRRTKPRFGDGNPKGDHDERL